MNVETRNSVFRLTVSRAFHSTRNFRNGAQLLQVRKFPGKVEKRTIQRKIMEIP